MDIYDVTYTTPYVRNYIDILFLIRPHCPGFNFNSHVGFVWEHRVVSNYDLLVLVSDFLPSVHLFQWPFFPPHQHDHHKSLRDFMFYVRHSGYLESCSTRFTRLLCCHQALKVAPNRLIQTYTVYRVYTRANADVEIGYEIRQ